MVGSYKCRKQNDVNKIRIDTAIDIGRILFLFCCLFLFFFFFLFFSYISV